MDHEKMKEQVLALYDGELGGSALTETQNHLASCLECRELYDSWAKTAQALFKAPKIETSEFFVHQVMQRIQDLEVPKTARAKWGFSLGWLVPVAGVAALFLAVISVPDTDSLSIDSLLLGSPESASAILYGQAPTADETLEFVMGG